jgi:hypothetical protein
MKTGILCTVLMLGLVGPICAQGSSDVKKTEVFIGPSISGVDLTGFKDKKAEAFPFDRTGFVGLEASLTRYVSHYVGLKFDFSGHYSRTYGQNLGFITPPCRFASVPCGVPDQLAQFNLRSSLYNFLGGIQIKNYERTSRFKPFAHLLLGVAHARHAIRDCVGVPLAIVPCVAEPTVSGTGLAAALGGGLDIRLRKKLDIRALQVDYNPTRLINSTQHNIRIGVGIVVH